MFLYWLCYIKSTAPIHDVFLQSCADTKNIKAMRINLYSRYYLGHAIDRPIFRLQAKRWCSVYWHNMLYQAVLILSSIIIYYDICTNHLLYPWDLQTADNFYLLRPGRLLLLYFLLDKVMNTKKCFVVMCVSLHVSFVEKTYFHFIHDISRKTDTDWSFCHVCDKKISLKDVQRHKNGNKTCKT